MRARRPRVRARRPAAGRPLREPEPRSVPVRLPARTCATRCRSAAGTSSSCAARPSGSCRSSPSEHGATAVYFASDVSPFAMARDKRVEAALQARPASSRAARPATSSPTSASSSRTSSSRRSGARRRELPRREIHGAPRKVPVPSDLTVGAIPAASATRATMRRRRDRRPQAHARLRPHDLRRHAQPARPRDVAALAPTCTSAASAPASSRTRVGGAYARQLAWRDFYAHVLLHHPRNTRHAYQARARRASSGTARTSTSTPGAKAARAFPVVDAGMRQLAQTGWMHNRARLITACFLVKDLHIDWRRGEQHFMRYLLDGDVAQNNGNWQWISSVGVDPRRCTAASTTRRCSSSATTRTASTCDTWAPDSRDARADRRPRGRARAHAARRTAAPAARKLPRMPDHRALRPARPARRASRRCTSPASARSPTSRRRTTGTAATSWSTSGSRTASTAAGSSISRAARATAPTCSPTPRRA